MSCTGKILISNWPWTQKFSQLQQAGRQLLLKFLTMVSIRLLRSDWSKFNRWVHSQNICSIWKLVYWQIRLTEVCVILWSVFICLFPLDVQSEMQLLSRFCCCSWLVCLLAFWLGNVPLVKVIRNAISDGIVFIFHFACTTHSSHKFGACQKWELDVHIGDIMPHRSRLFWLNSPDMKTFYKVVLNSITFCAKEVRAPIVLPIEWVQLVL